MKFTFETEFGKIECEKYDNDNGLAYFSGSDMFAEISKDGIFRHPMTHQTFQISWPLGKAKIGSDAILDYLTYREIGRSKPN
jgi:hypothetical protein